MAREYRLPPLGRVIGGVIAAGGVWHALTPFVLGYFGQNAPTVNQIATGLALAAFGGVRAAGVREWPLWACAALGVWLLIAPQVFGSPPGHPFPNDSMWGGLGVLACCAISLVGRRAQRPSELMTTG